MNLYQVIDAARQSKNLRPPSGRPLLRISIEGTPSYLMANSLAAFRAEMQATFLKRLDIVGGGYGCLHVCFDLGSCSEIEIEQLRELVSEPENIEYFRNKYNITQLSVERPTANAKGKLLKLDR
jgi:hypothetical protein